jgi:hypothetical protein
MFTKLMILLICKNEKKTNCVIEEIDWICLNLLSKVVASFSKAKADIL